MICDVEQIRRYANLVDSASVETLEGFGHMIHYEAPELAAQAIERFIGAS